MHGLLAARGRGGREKGRERGSERNVERGKNKGGKVTTPYWHSLCVSPDVKVHLGPSGLCAPVPVSWHLQLTKRVPLLPNTTCLQEGMAEPHARGGVRGDCLAKNIIALPQGHFWRRVRPSY